MKLYMDQDACNSYVLFVQNEDDDERKEIFTIMRSDQGDMDDAGWEHLVDQMATAANAVLADSDDMQDLVNSVEQT